MFFINTLKILQERWGEEILPRIWEHLYLSAVSLFWISLLGISIGIWMSRNKKAEKLFSFLCNTIYTIPSIALFGLLIVIPFLGLNKLTAIIALTCYGLLPVIRSTFVGFKTLDQSVVQAAKLAGANKWQHIRYIEIPLSLPYILSGLRTSVVMTISLASIASFIGAGGLGTLIWLGISTRFPEMVFIGSFFSALLAILADRTLAIVETLSKRKNP